jgi:CheY-like chemotaxis protein
MKPARIPRLLVVDDEPICRRAVTDLAQALGLPCDSAADGLAGLALARDQHYDLLLIDWRMPGMTGSELMLALRADPAAASARSTMVLVTGEAVDFDQERARGFDAVLAKPLGVDQLTALLRLRIAADPSVAAAMGDGPPLLDDATALTALGGNRELLDSLRQMLREELQQDRVRLPVLLAEGAIPALRERLHQLTGGARYCGAPALAEASDRLRQAAKAGLPTDGPWQHFEQILERTRAALQP